ncbi:MAG: hypothetical protein NVSMB48_10700 [Marmoricola sp.]
MLERLIKGSKSKMLAGAALEGECGADVVADEDLDLAVSCLGGDLFGGDVGECWWWRVLLAVSGR